MTYPVPDPPVRAAGTPVTAALYEDDVTEGIQFLSRPPHFVGTQTSAQSLTDSTWTPLDLNTHQVDNYGGHSTVTNNSRYVAQRAGWYTVSGAFASAANGSGFRAVRLQVNGTAVQGTAIYFPNNGGNDVSASTPTRDVFLNVNDYIEVAGWQGSGGSLNTSVASGELGSALWVRFSNG